MASQLLALEMSQESAQTLVRFMLDTGQRRITHGR